MLKNRSIETRMMSSENHAGVQQNISRRSSITGLLGRSRISGRRENGRGNVIYIHLALLLGERVEDLIVKNNISVKKVLINSAN